jgi:hypothetical protein
MKDLRLRRVLTASAIVFAFAASGAAPVLGADDGAGARLHLTATFVASTAGFDPSCGVLVVVTGGAGQGTHVGNGTWADHECVDPFSHPGQIHVVGVGTASAANGDQLVVDYDATGDPPAPVTMVIHLQGTFTVDPDASTGRFAGATGGGSFTVDGVANGGSETAVFDGTIVLGNGH